MYSPDSSFLFEHTLEYSTHNVYSRNHIKGEKTSDGGHLYVKSFRRVECSISQKNSGKLILTTSYRIAVDNYRDDII